MGFTKKKKIIVGAGICIAVAGSIPCLHLCKHSQYQKEEPETTVVTTKPEDSLNVCDYSMKNAFQMGLVNGIGSYVNQIPYKVDTIRLSRNNMDNVKKGYYTKITNGDSTEEYIRRSEILMTGILLLCRLLSLRILCPR